LIFYLPRALVLFASNISLLSSCLIILNISVEKNHHFPRALVLFTYDISLVSPCLIILNINVEKKHHFLSPINEFNNYKNDLNNTNET
jgi:hypothetical protein